MAEILIRPLQPQDAPAVGVLEAQIALYHAQLDPTQHRAVAADGVTQMAAWEKQGKKVWGAEKEGQIVGVVTLEERLSGQEPYDSRATEKVWYINTMVVEENIRGQGIGTAMMAHVEAEARKAGANTLAITYMEGNEGAKRLYTAQGFRQAKITMRKAL